jgi:putative transposase
MRQGYSYLCAAMDWHSRFVISWRLSNSMDTEFVLEALDEALEVSQIRRRFISRNTLL